MIGSPISRYWKVTWKFVAPFMIAGLLLATFISKIVNPITYTAYDRQLVCCFNSIFLSPGNDILNTKLSETFLYHINKQPLN